MVSVTPAKRKSGYAWRVQAKDDDGKMRQESFTDPDARTAERAARQFARLVERVGMSEAIRIRDARSAKESDVPTLSAWFDQYLDKTTGYLRDVDDAGRQDYRRKADRYILPRLGEMPVDMITRQDVDAWLAWLEEQPSSRYKGKTLAPKTVTSYQSLLSQALAKAVEVGHCKSNVAYGAKVSRGRSEPMVILTVAELGVLLHFLPEKWRPLVLWLAGTGMRWGEVTALTWGDIDREHRPPMVHITKALKKAVKGGQRTMGGTKGTTRRHTGERRIAVPPELVDQLGTPRGGDKLVFPSSVDKPLWSAPFWSRVWGPAVEAANDPVRCKAAKLTPLGKKPRVHDLRHFHASTLIAEGRPLTYIQRRLGHKDVSTTSNVYGHLMPDATQGDADTVALVLGALLPATVEDGPAQITA